ncbi:hypothetical protein [Streptomyces sp. URMC 123]|uniref:hypothetical protein n=1 Tax=Streptomyces sp. URMC 123 TaxID=3423403 RepID=UPI003F1C5799
MPEQPHVCADEFITPARDRAHARIVHQSLQALATGHAGPVLQEMAREVLAGRVGLREALRVGVYADALGDRVRVARAAWERLPAAERELHQEEARRHLAGQGTDRDDRANGREGQ